LTPELLATEEFGQPPRSLFVGTGDEDRRPCPSDAYRIDRPTNTGPQQLVIDEQLILNRRISSPRFRPGRCDQARLSKFSTRWSGMVAQPVAKCHPAGIEFVHTRLERDRHLGEESAPVFEFIGPFRHDGSKVLLFSGGGP
jgi:hypothetical protein